MPNLDFYASDEDWPAVVEVVFALGVFRVFQAYSEPDHNLSEFSTPNETTSDPKGGHLMLFVAGSGPEPTAERIELLPGVAGDATFRYSCAGWGLVQLYHGGSVGKEQLRWSHTNHNTQKRAAAWAGTAPELGDPESWNWPLITSASSKLNRTIRRMSVDTIGSHPVLPHAAQFIADAGLRYEYGTGIHATPALGGIDR